MAESIETVAVLGAGTMGAGIAQAVALAGTRVRLCDVDEAALAHGLDRALTGMEEGIRRGKVTESQRDRARELLSSARDVADAGPVDLVIEAIPEVMELKKKVFTRLGGICPESTLLASNTSSLSITEIASCVPVPSRVIGMHFFNPPHIMKLIEIVRAEQTGEDTLERALEFSRALGKEPIVVKDSPGFATSRLGLALGLEAMRMVEQGVASAEDIDRAMELGYGHPMGPLKVSDLVGLDVRLGIAEILHRELGGNRFSPPVILRNKVRSGKLGKKTGEGFHRWPAK